MENMPAMAQNQLSMMTEEDRTRLLTQILTDLPSITWRYLGRPGSQQPDSPEAAPASPNWCQCGRCRDMPTQLERVCCRATPCLNRDPECALVTRDRFGLDMGRTYHNDRWAEPAPDPEDEDSLHRQFRFQAYRHFILWQFGYLGRGARRVIPSCVVWSVRNEFPNPDGHYVGFRDVPL